MSDYWKEIEAQQPARPPAETLVPPGLPPVGSSVAYATEPPPLPSTEPRVSWGWIAGMIVSGLLAAVFSYRSGALQQVPYGPSYAIGTVIGGLIIWPLIVIGLFSIGPRFRTKRNRAIILVAVWSLVALSQLSTLRLKNYREGGSAPRPISRATSNATYSGGDLTRTPPRAVKPAPLPIPAAAQPETEFDFSAGSDQRLIKLIDGAQEDRYRAIVAAYARACEARPQDARLALERVRFIERFADSEDNVIKDAEIDRQAAADSLKSRFPDAPTTVLYRLERLFGPAFDDEARHYGNAVVRWPNHERASFYLLRAQRSKDEAQQTTLARLSFAAEPTTAAGMLLLQHLPKNPPTPETLNLFHHRVFDGAQPWEKLQLMNALFDSGQGKQALGLYNEIKLKSAPLVQTTATAKRLAATGHVGVAREIIKSLPTNPWNSVSLHRDRFHFELDHGTAEQAVAAYRELQAVGVKADPFLRERAALLRKHPFSGWHIRDAIGLVLIALSVLTLFLLPFVVLMPVHYWSLLRERKGRSSSWPETLWGLPSAWAALAALLCADVLCVWIFFPVALQAWTQKYALQATTPPSDATLVKQQFLAWAIMAVVLAGLLALARGWRLFKLHAWSWGRTLGFAGLGFVALRFFLLAYAAAWPGAIEGDLASLSSNTEKLCLALFKLGGSGGMIFCVAMLVPVIEELMFRGVLLQAFSRHIPFFAANALQACLFAAVHENLRLFPFFVAFGMVCGWLARRSESLVAPMIVHALNNLLVCLVLMARYPASAL